MAIPKKYRGIVGAGTKAAGLIGIPGAVFPPADVAFVGTIWSTMLVAVAARDGRKLDRELTTKAIIGAMGGAGGYLLACKIYTNVLKLVPGVGLLVTIGINSSLDYIFTYYLRIADCNVA